MSKILPKKDFIILIKQLELQQQNNEYIDEEQLEILEQNYQHQQQLRQRANDLVKRVNQFADVIDTGFVSPKITQVPNKYLEEDTFDYQIKETLQQFKDLSQSLHQQSQPQQNSKTVSQAPDLVIAELEVREVQKQFKETQKVFKIQEARKLLQQLQTQQQRSVSRTKQQEQNCDKYKSLFQKLNQYKVIQASNRVMNYEK